MTLVGDATLITTASNDFALRKHRPGNPDIFSGHKVSGNFGPDSAAPVVRSAALNAAGNAVVVSFNEWLAGTVELGGSPPATSVLTVTVDGVPRTPTSVSINRHQVTLSLPSGMRVVSGQDVTLTYAQPVNNPLQDRYGNQVASFVDRDVTNNIPLVWGSTDYDTDNDGLIEISRAGQLNAVRWDTDGDGDPSRGYYLDAGAFAGAAQGLGCPASGCVGYEIGTDTRGEITIDLSSYTNWKPIPEFTGTLDGNGHTISGLTIAASAGTGFGLFASVGTSGAVRDLNLTGVSVSLTGNARGPVGAVAAENQGRISEVSVEGSVTGRSQSQEQGTGGLVGDNHAGGRLEVVNSAATVSMTSPTGWGFVGGLVGRNAGRIAAAFATGAVTGSGSGTIAAGGLVGRNVASGTIVASYSTGTIANSGGGSSVAGGLVGSDVGTVTDSYYDRTTTGRSDTGRGTPKSTSELQSPTGYSGIYASWNLDLDGDNKNDFPWRFPAGKYPELNLGQPTIIGVALLSPPADGATFKAGELIRLQATFNEDVAFGAGTVHPWPSLSLHSLDGWFTAEAQPPRQESDKGFSKTMEFGYRVRAGDQATDQLAAGTHPLSGGGLFGGTPTIASRGGTPANPLMDLFPLGVTVDGGAVATCRQDLTIRPWSDLEYHRLKWSTGKRIDWDGSCYSRSRPGQHANYYTFTLTEEAQVRLHAEGRGQPGLMLREGRVYTGDVIHHAARYGSRSNAVRIEQVLQPGTYTLETAGAHSLWTGTVERPPSAAAGIWQADLVNLQRVGGSSGPAEEGCDNRQPQLCSSVSVLTEDSFTHEGTTYAVHLVLYNVDATPSTLFLGLNPLPAAGTDWTLYVNGQAFPFGDATRHTGVAPQLRWSNVSLSLAVGDTVSLALAEGSSSGQPSQCAVAIDRGQSFAARWDAECASVSNPGLHAAYYVYTPDSSGITRVTLTSPDTDEHLYLWEDGRQIRETGSSGHKFAEMAWVARAGRTYVLEVTADSPNAGSRYLLAMHGGGGTTEAPSIASGCRQTVEFGRQAGGVLDWPCFSKDRPGTYARYYTFTIDQDRDVRLELYGSQIAGADMTLRSDTNGSGPYVIQSHFPGIGPVRARIDKEALPAGTYTIEVMASSPGNGGHLTLTVRDLPAKFTPRSSDRDLVSNLGQSNGGSANDANDHAQNFTTGDHAAGYKLTEVRIDLIIDGTDLPSYEVEIWSVGSNGQPENKLGTLTKPYTLTSGANTFTSSAGIDLEPSTSYAVVYDLRSRGANWFVQNAHSTANGEDSGAAAGWSIGDDKWFRNWDSAGGWGPWAESLKIAVVGYPKPKPSGCVTKLGNITYVGTHSDRVTGEWASGGCGSYSHTRNYARFYRFTVTETVELAFSLQADTDARMYLFEGASFRAHTQEDRNFIRRNLAPGTYTIEVTTAEYGDDWQTGSYTLSWRRTGPAPPEPPVPNAPTTGTIWEAALTVQAEDYPEGFLGCWNSCSAALSSHRFSFGGTWYQIGAIGHDEDSFSLGISRTTLPPGTWTLYVQRGDDPTKEHAFTLSSRVRSWGWGGITLGWTAGQQVSLRLVKS